MEERSKAQSKRVKATAPPSKRGEGRVGLEPADRASRPGPLDDASTEPNPEDRVGGTDTNGHSTRRSPTAIPMRSIQLGRSNAVEATAGPSDCRSPAISYGLRPSRTDRPSPTLKGPSRSESDAVGTTEARAAIRPGRLSRSQSPILLGLLMQEVARSPARACDSKRKRNKAPCLSRGPRKQPRDRQEKAPLARRPGLPETNDKRHHLPHLAYTRAKEGY